MIRNFTDRFGAIDRERWRSDIILRLLDDMQSDRDGISTRDLCGIYFEREDLETIIFVGQQLQAVREMLQERTAPLLLLNDHYRWYVVSPDDPARARMFLVNRTRRMLNAYRRLGDYAEIGRETYQLPATDGLIRAIEGVDPGMGELREAIGEDEEGSN